MKMKELMNLSNSLVIDTGPLLLPLTREHGWRKVRKLLVMHEEGKVSLYVGLFNLAELIYAMHRLGYETGTSLRYAKLISEKLHVVNNISYMMWMGKLRVEAYRHRYNIPWGDISSTAVAISLDIPVLVLNEDKHFEQLMVICKELGKEIKVIHVNELMD